MKDSLIADAAKCGPMCEAAYGHMMNAGVSNGAIEKGRALGLNFSQILALIIKWGPAVFGVLDELAKLINPPTPVLPPPVLPPKSEAATDAGKADAVS